MASSPETTSDLDNLAQAVLVGLQSPRAALCLVGLPGSGASTLGAAVAAQFRGPKLVVTETGVEATLQAMLGSTGAARLARLGPALMLVDARLSGAAARELAAALEAARDAAPELRILGASHAPLGLGGERPVEIPPLTLRESLGVLGAASPTPEAKLARLIRVLGGHPLALHLASRRLAVLSVDDLIARCENDPFEALRDRDTSHTRQSSLAATFSAWWETLDPPDRETLTLLAAYPASFPLSAPESLLDPGRVAPGSISEDRVERALHRRWVRRAEAGRFRLEPWIRRWIRHIDPTGWDVACRRLTEHALALTDRYGIEPQRDARAGEILRHLGAEQENLLGLLDRRSPPEDVRSLVRLGRVAAEIEMVVPSPEAADRAGRVWRFVEAHRGDADPTDYVRSGLIHASLLNRQGRFDEASVRYRELEDAAFEAHAGSSLTATVLVYHGDHLMLRGRTEQAYTKYQEARERAIHDGDVVTQANATTQLSTAAAKLDLRDEADRFVHEALALAPRLDSPLRQARTWQNLTFAMDYLGRHDEVVQVLSLALPILSSLNAPRLIGLARLQLASSLVALDRLDEAAIHAEAGVELMGSVGDLRLLPIGRGLLASTRLLQNPRREAANLREAADLLAARGFPEGLPYRTLEGMAWILIDELGLARETFRAVLAVDQLAEASFRQHQAAAAMLFEMLPAFDNPDGAARAAIWRDRARPLLTDRMLVLCFDAVVQHLEAGERALWVRPGGHGWRYGDQGGRLEGVPARLLQALAEAKRRGETMNTEAIARAVWPEQPADDDKAAGRVRVGLNGLRKVGFREMIARNGEGWILEPSVRWWPAPRDAERG